MNKDDTDWHISSNRGTASASFVVERRVANGFQGTIVFAANSIERPNAASWETKLPSVEVAAAAFQSLQEGMERWISDSEGFSATLLSGEIRLNLELRLEDESLLLGPGKAGLHLVWDGIAAPRCEMAFVVDQTCVQESLQLLRALVTM